MRLLALTALIFVAATEGCARTDAPPEDVVASAAPPSTVAPAESPTRQTQPAVDTPALAEGELADSSDFVVSGFVLGMDSSAVRALLGNPDSVRTDDNPLDVGAKMHMWHYSSVNVDLMFEGKLTGVFLLDSTRATHRGLRVGDPEARVYELYGRRTPSPDGAIQYSWATEYQRVLQVSLVQGRVSRIFVGLVLD